MSTRIITILISALVLLSLSSCSKPPVAEMQNAQQAITAAKTAQAEQYAPEAYRAAMDSLNAAMAAKQQQDSKFALIRSYGKANEMFVRAEAAAKQAEAQAATQKEQVKNETAQLIQQAKSEIDAATAAISKAPRGKGSKVDLAMMQNDLNAATASLADAQNDFDSENYLVAKSKVTAVIAKVQMVNQELTAATAKKAGR
jgi:hypothetical protein